MRKSRRLPSSFEAAWKSTRRRNGKRTCWKRRFPSSGGYRAWKKPGAGWRTAHPVRSAAPWDHPYAQGNVPAPDEAAAALAAARADLKAAAEAVAGLRIEQAEVDKDLEQLSLRKQECTDKIAASEALVGRGCAELSIEVSRTVSTLLSRLLKENGDTLDRETKIVQAAETMEKELATLRESVEKAKDAGRFGRARRAGCGSRKRLRPPGVRTRRQGSRNARRSAWQGNERSTTSGVRLRGRGVVHGRPGLGSAYLDGSPRTVDFASEGTVGTRTADRRSGHENGTAKGTDQQNRFRTQRATGPARCLLRERETIRRERGELFGDKNPDTEEARLAEAVAGAEGGVEASRLEVDDATRELGKLKNSLEVLARSMAERAGQLKAAEETFLIRLNELGFSDEAGYVAARLPEEEREQLQRLARELEREQTELASMEREKQFRSKTEREKNVTDRPREELDREAEDLVAGQKELQQGIGGIRQKLKDNENLKKRQRERAIAVEARKKECSRWDNLHELIGSADGKKYRNFAQGLTFDLMIGHANRQLRKMTDRYLLTREDAQPLELNVVDNYQAGEIRSTKNLSGGESFIVSLSLALGLSRMAGKKVRVDSLFLDEGFGTLDEESLDTALETLARLQQDGKIIGVISHVAALKERIPTQIQIIPRTGGRSGYRRSGVRGRGLNTSNDIRPTKTLNFNNSAFPERGDNLIRRGTSLKSSPAGVTIDCSKVCAAWARRTMSTILSASSPRNRIFWTNSTSWRPSIAKPRRGDWRSFTTRHRHPNLSMERVRSSPRPPRAGCPNVNFAGEWPRPGNSVSTSRSRSTITASRE